MLAMTAPMSEERVQWDRGASARPTRLAGSTGASPVARVALRRTYTRRRIVAALVLTVLVLGAWAGLRAVGTTLPLAGSERSTPMASIASSTYVVQPGETLWSIARRLDPDGDPRPVVDRLAAANGGTQLRAGEIIVLSTPTHG